MRLSRVVIAVSFCLLFASFTAPAQKRKGRPAKAQKPIVVAPIDTEALKNLLSEQRERPLLVNAGAGARRKAARMRIPAADWRHKIG